MDLICSIVSMSLLWADDLIILSDIEEGLSTALKKLESYCDINLININTIKTKCMIFNKKRTHYQTPVYIQIRKTRNC